MASYRLKSAYLATGWAADVRITVSDQGLITAIDAGDAALQVGAPAPERIDGFVVPGMPNAHSHAFQRVMAGNTEFRLSAHDSFWTWRQAMYAVANRIEPDDLQIVATQLYIEMLKAGYTSVAEFHYLHRQRDGSEYWGANALWEAIGNAAQRSGIGLTFLPTLYQYSDFGQQPLKAEQARFESQLDAFVRRVDDRVAVDRRRGSSRLRTGAAFHSLRAVPIQNLTQAAALLRSVDAGMPVHIHIAEQELEVRACERATGRRPIELLLDQGVVGPHWCLVHATHATAEELKNIAATDATVCLSISTEANLGDGLFDAAKFIKSAGRICIGSDSQSAVNPAEELRWLEYQQRVREKRRVVLAKPTEPHVGTSLWRDAALHGAQALGQPVGSLAVGSRADWLVLDEDHPAMAAAASENALDHLVFAGAGAAIRDVMVAGDWVIKDYRHDEQAEIQQDFREVMQRFR
jgi:formimidoylglutamate deiminase